MIEVKDLVKTYGALAAVDHVTFSVPKGSILGLLGPNGAGKTTTMRVLTTSLSMTGGKVTVDGYDVSEQPHEVRKRIGYLPEIPPIYGDMNVISYLKFVAEIKEIPSDKKANRIGEILETLGLEDKSRKLIGHLSLGYRQRVGLAQALIHDPDVLILDEPTRGLDPNQILDIRKLIKSFSGKKTIILSTHILQEVTATCDQVAIIHNGKLVAEFPVDNLPQEDSNDAGIRALQVEVKGPAGEVVKAFEKLDGVLSVQVLGRESQGISKFVVNMSGSKDGAETLFKCVVSNKWVLRQLTPMSEGLEEVFRKLTSGENIS